MTKLIDITGKALSGEWGYADEIGSGIPVLRTTNFTNDGVVNYNNVVTRTITKKKIEEKYLRKGDIIIEKSGGSDKQPVGRVIYFDGPDDTYLFNNFTGLLRVRNREKWYPRYVFYSLFANYRKGGTKPYENKTTGLHNLKTDDYVSRYEVKETHITRQIEVCNQLDRVFSIVKMRQIELQKLDDLVKARFVEMFGKQFTGPKIRICDIAKPYIGLTYKPENVSDEGTIVLRSGNIQNQSLQTKKDVVRVLGVKIADDKYIRDKDILMCARNGSARLVGKSCLIRNPEEKMAFGAFMSVVRTDYPYFLQGFFSSHYFKTQLTTVGTTSVNQITSKMLNNYEVIQPTLEQENDFAMFCEQVDKSKVVVQEALDKAQLLFDSLMQEYFG
ncbi:MAG: restriction endonuclease subunit S [Bacillota bacterium]|nr:restriction endonuclease subunit S [Bacillota bacterium]